MAYPECLHYVSLYSAAGTKLILLFNAEVSSLFSFLHDKLLLFDEMVICHIIHP